VSWVSKRIRILRHVLILCLPLLVLSIWIRSRFATDEISYWKETTSARTIMGCRLLPGYLELNLSRTDYSLTNDYPMIPTSNSTETPHGLYFSSNEVAQLPEPWTHTFQISRVFYFDRADFLAGKQRSIGFSFAGIFLLSIVPAVLRASARYASKRREIPRLRGGHCSVCGYDLRGSAEKCPECGSAIRTMLRKWKGQP